MVVPGLETIEVCLLFVRWGVFGIGLLVLCKNDLPFRVLDTSTWIRHHKERERFAERCLGGTIVYF